MTHHNGRHALPPTSWLHDNSAGGLYLMMGETRELTRHISQTLGEIQEDLKAGSTRFEQIDETLGEIKGEIDQLKSRKEWWLKVITASGKYALGLAIAFMAAGGKISPEWSKKLEPVLKAFSAM
jgi:hypothetical protein